MEQQEKLSKFKNAVFREVDAKTEQIRREADEKKEQAIRKFTEQLDRSASEEIHTKTEQIRQKFSQETAKCSLDAKRNLLAKRSELTQKLFDETAEKLAAFSKTAEYQELLLKKIASFSASVSADKPELLVGASDFQNKTAIEKAFGRDCTVVCDPAITLGGFVVRDAEKGLFYDETFAQKLADQKSYFIEHSIFND